MTTRKTLRPGAQGADVVELAQLLNAAMPGLQPPLQGTGHYGDRTRSVVEAFQSRAGLPVNGVVGPRTWAALDAATGAVKPEAEPRWLTVAKGEIGVREENGPRHHPRILQYHDSTTLRALTDEVPWCASFVNWCLREAGHKGTNSAAAISWAKWGLPLQTPRPGAVCVIRRKGTTGVGDPRTGSPSGNHVGFWISGTPTHLRLLGGNQSNQVRYTDFPLSAYIILAYRWPADTPTPKVGP